MRHSRSGPDLLQLQNKTYDLDCCNVSGEDNSDETFWLDMGDRTNKRHTSDGGRGRRVPDIIIWNFLAPSMATHSTGLNIILRCDPGCPANEHTYPNFSRSPAMTTGHSQILAGASK
jgi:hypothetical protein